MLASEAVRLAPEWKAVFLEGRCHVHGVEEWPVAYERWSTIGFVHPDPQKRSKFDVPRKPDPIEVVRAAQALSYRYRIFLSMLQTGEICAVGLNDVSGSQENILRPIWSHEEFHLDAMTGELLQDNAHSEDANNRYIRRYIGVVIQTLADDVVRPGRVSIPTALYAAKSASPSEPPTDARPPVDGKHTAHRASIAAAISVLWSGGDPSRSNGQRS